MKKVTRTLALLLTLCTLVSCLSIFVSADSVVSTEKKDVTASTASVLKSIQADSTLSDSDKIQQIITLLFDAKREQLANTDLADFDFSIFGKVNQEKGADLLYFSRYVTAQKHLHTALGFSLADCRTDLTFDSIKIVDDTASVSVYEWFTYYEYTPNDGIAEFESGRGKDYTIELQKTGNVWTITSIDFYDLSTDTLRDFDISIDEFVRGEYEAATTCTPDNSVTTFGMDLVETAAANGRTITSFNANAFKTYALDYDGSMRNPYFYDCSSLGGDCQNFASQCVWAGLGGSNYNLSNAQFPMINSTLAGNSGREWYIYPNGAHSASWTSCYYFRNYLSAGSSSQIGLYGSIGSNTAAAQVGDILHIRDSNGDYSHALVVVGIHPDATPGAATINQIYVSAHTEDEAYVRLSEVSRTGVYKVLHISGLVS